MARNNQRGRNNNNPEGHNQHDRGWTDRPLATAAAAVAAVGAGVFLWSRRSQISDQFGDLGNKSAASNAFELADAGNAATARTRSSGNNRSSGGQPTTFATGTNDSTL